MKNVKISSKVSDQVLQNCFSSYVYQTFLGSTQLDLRKITRNLLLCYYSQVKTITLGNTSAVAVWWDSAFLVYKPGNLVTIFEHFQLYTSLNQLN